MPQTNVTFEKAGEGYVEIWLDVGGQGAEKLLTLTADEFNAMKFAFAKEKS